MAEHQVLHVTDFHILEPDGEAEHLRSGYFEEYVLDLKNFFANEIRDPNLSIVITGDFVDSGKIENFSHAARVIESMCKAFGVPAERTAVCIGNHDVVRDSETSGRSEEAREAFARFSQSYANGKSIQSSERAVLCELGASVSAVMIDTTLRPDKIPEPGRLSVPELDSLVRLIRSRDTDELVIMAGHYPVQQYFSNASPFDDDDPDYNRKHIWRDASYLIERIRSSRRERQTLWLMGDVHRSGHFVEDNQHFVATGRFGTPVSTSSLLPRQASLVSIADSGMSKVSIAAFPSPGHIPTARAGRWVKGENAAIRATTLSQDATASVSTDRESVFSTRESDDVRPVVIDATLVVGPDEGRAAHNYNGPSEQAGPAGGCIVEVIDEGHEARIIEAIRSGQMYQLGRFETSANEVSLCWIPIGPLLNTGSLLALTVDRMTSWLAEHVLGEQDPSTVLLLGMDCWGAVIASQLSALTGIQNYCLPARGGGKHSLPEEGIGGYVAARASECSTLVLVTDVVASGISLRALYSALITGYAKLPTVPKNWFALSVLCDATRDRSDQLDFLERHATACGSLKMPIIQSNDLPDRSILPPTLSFL